MFAHYEVMGKIGEGGMGEVYRARDTKLNRDVALKLLPETLSESPERIARFQREAQVLASLNHSNIAAIYGLEQVGDKRVLVMELAGGQDLSAWLAAGPIASEDALEIARQIATALEEAHDKGIVHRDLKPANVNVTPDSQVKVLDFGLAKAFEENPSESSPALSQSPTFSAAMTGANVILGSAAYMSPEQAKGKAADRRSDIWAFGVVLFEMLTGKQTFEGETISETLAAVMKDQIPWGRLPATTPPAIRNLLNRCLERDPRKRLQAIGEARIAIEAIQQGLDDAAVAETGSPSQAPGGSSTGFLRFLPWALTVIAIAVALFMMSQGSPGIDTTPIQDGVSKFHLDYDVRQPTGSAMKIAPDGQRLVYVQGRSLWIRDLGDLEPRILVNLESESPENGVQVPFWSPDSRSIAYAAEGKLWKVSVGGGNPFAICNLKESINGGAWYQDDRIVFTAVRGPMHEVSARGGDPNVLLERGENDIDFHHPAALPGGATLYTVHRKEGVDTIEILVDGDRRQVLRIEDDALTVSPQVVNHPRYCSSTGHVLFRRDKGVLGVWALPFDAATLKATGEPFLVAADGTWPSVSNNGTLIYYPDPASGMNELVWFDREGNVTGTLGEPGRNLRSPAISPDETRVAYVVDDGDAGEIWVIDIARQTRTRLTFTPTNELDPAWVPGRNMVAFSAETDSGRAICARSADGTGETVVLAQGLMSPTFSSDGRFLAGELGGLVIVDLESKGDPEVMASDGDGFYNPEISPDGRYVAFLSWEAGGPTTYIRPVGGGSGKWELPQSGDSDASWIPGEIVYSSLEERNELLSISVQTDPSLSLGAPQVLFDLDRVGAVRFTDIDVTADGQRILIARVQDTEELRGGIVVVKNWAAEFRDSE